jgi:glycosyltransferase involved in cell wall biosynthesis
VESVLSQSLATDDFEVIVVNDSGQPLPPAAWQASPQVRMVTTNRRERSFARNTGAALARGAYLHFLDDDDWLAPGALTAFRQLAQTTQAGWLYGSAHLIDAVRGVEQTLLLGEAGNCALYIIGGEWIPLQASLVRAREFFAIGGFNPLSTPGEDRDLCNRYALVGEFAFTPATVACLDRSSESTTNYALSLAHSRREREKVFNEPGLVRRLQASSVSPYWRGRAGRVLLASTLTNLRAGRPMIAGNRFGSAAACIASRPQIVLTADFWRAMLHSHTSRIVEKRAAAGDEPGPMNTSSLPSTPLASDPDATLSGAAPRVSIGLAVRNGELYLRQAIDSILAQTFTDFELIICDNASTDNTEAICRAYAEQDERVRYWRNLRNIGGTNNENLTITKARGEYFRLAAYDDMLVPDLLEKCVAVLDSRPDIVLCYSYVTEIDGGDNFIQITKRNKGTATTAHRRMHELMYRDHTCEMTYGLIRTDVLRKTRLYQNYTDADRTLLCELALYGRFYEIQEPLFYKRYHPANQYLDWRARMSWFHPGTEGKITFPNWMQFADMFATVRRVPLPASEKLRCYLVTGRWSLRHGLRMAKEAAINAYMAVHSKQWRIKKHARVHNWE